MEERELNPDIFTYYDSGFDEDERLRSGIAQLELVRTKEIIARFLPHEPARIVDVGGGTGVHAAWLLEAGHTVELVDPVPRHVDRARQHLGASREFHAQLADARALPFGEDSFDVVLMLGPLYHLTASDERAAAWKEAKRVVRPNGLIIGSVITRFASLFSGLSDGAIFDPVFRGIVERDLADGQHRNPPGSEFFTTAYLHHPDEAGAEAEAAGLSVEAVLGVEGIAMWIPRLQKSWADPDRRESIIDAARAIEAEPTLLGLGPHVLIVAHKPE